MLGQNLAHYRQPVKAFFALNPKNLPAIFYVARPPKKPLGSLNMAIFSHLPTLPSGGLEYRAGVQWGNQTPLPELIL